ncbi:MAG: ErpA-related iron-sulfur cluster insertion protein [Desulfovibrio sp.]|jgi:iron-sulfur cluster insertion protein|nr:ErpA-related iron-sulfur cluster insertion protein [Desulfovibrio sp.]
MLLLTVPKDAVAGLRTLLEKEESGACFRLREFQIGCSCNKEMKRELRLTIDWPEDEDARAVVEGLHFVMDNILTSNYGNAFAISLDKNRIPQVTKIEA